jgi:hypothetical protein
MVAIVVNSIVQKLRGAATGKCCALAMIVMSLLLVPVAAWANAFTVSAVPVDVTAESPTAARQQAILQGQAAAFDRLMKTVISPEDRELVPELSPEELESLVADFSVAGEKSSATRYIATMTVNFDEARVADMLRNFGVTLLKGGEQTIILLGVYQAEPDAQPLLWEPDNPWRLLLNQTAVSRGLFPVALPLGDMLDTAQVPAEAALALDRTAMDSLIQRYGADEVVVVHVLTTPDKGSSMTLKRYPQDLPARLKTGETPIADDLPAALGDLAAHAVLSIAQGEKSRRKAIVVGETDSLAALIPVQSIADWVRTEATLSALPMVQTVRLRASRTDVLQIAIQYSGDLMSLMAAVEKLGFTVRTYDGYWEIIPPSETATPVLS